MAPPRSKTTTVASTSALVDGIRQKRLESLRVLQHNVQSTQEWLVASIESCKHRILENSGRKAVVAAVAPTETAAKKKSSDEDVADSQLIPPNVMDYVNSLKVKQLQAELRQRGKETSGLKKVLRERLLHAIKEEYAAEHESNKKVLSPKGEEESANNHDAVDSDSKQQDCKKKSANHVSYMKKPKPVDETMSSSNNPIDLTANDPMDVEPEVPSAESIKKKNNNTMTKQEEEDAMDVDVVVAENEPEKESSSQRGVAQLASSERKRSRSPMKVVLSAKKKQLSPKIAKITASWPSNNKSDTTDDLSGIKSKSNNDPTKEESADRIAAAAAAATAGAAAADKDKKECVIESDKNSFSAHSEMSDTMPPPATGSSDKGKAPARLLTTPAIDSSGNSGKSLGVLSASQKQTGSSSSGTSALKSQSVKAKNEARKAKLAEIRGKSKPLASKPVSTTSEFTKTLSSLKSTNNVHSAGKDAKRNLLMEKMREKAKALGKQGVTTSELSKPAEKCPISTTKPAPSTTAGTKASKAPTPGSSQSNKKHAPSQALSPMDTYELSDHESDSDSESDDDSSRKVRKPIPVWAQKSNLIRALEHQYSVGPLTLDPDEIFGEVQTCDLEAIFDQKKMRYKHRTSSGNWAKDRATAAEKLAYKRTIHNELCA